MPHIIAWSIAAMIVPALFTLSYADEPSDQRFFPPYRTCMSSLAASDVNAVPYDLATPPGSDLSVDTPEKSPGLLNWAHETFVDGASITLGYGVRRSSFTFTRKSDNASGTIVDRDFPAFFLIYSTKPSFFTDSKFGYTFMLKFSTFSMDQQIASGALIGNTPVDVHTDLQGIIGYALPSVYYQWGEHRFEGTFLQAGLGLGLATTTYSGTIELRSPTASELVSVRDQSYSLHIAWSTFLEARWHHWGTYLSLMRARLPGDAYNTLFEDASLYLGYRFFF